MRFNRNVYRFVENLFLSALSRQKALNVTGNNGVEPAMEWLLAHSGESEVAPESVSADSTNTAEPNAIGEAAVASGSSSTEPTAEVKSFKCEEWYDINI